MADGRVAFDDEGRTAPRGAGRTGSGIGATLIRGWAQRRVRSRQSVHVAVTVLTNR